MLGLLLCRFGFHWHADNGNCWRCGFRYHGAHVGPYAAWAARRGGHA